MKFRMGWYGFIGCLGCLGAVQTLAEAAPSVEKAPAKVADIQSANGKRIMQEIRRKGATAVLLNVWATWCDPCREEMPDLLRFYRENRHRGLRLVLVSADSKDDKGQAVHFLTSKGVDFRTFIKDGDDMAFIEGIDARWNGTIPISFLYDAEGKAVQIWTGKVSFQALKQALDDLLAPKKIPPSERSQR